MTIKLQIARLYESYRICITNGQTDPRQFLSMTGAFDHISEIFLNDSSLRVQVDAKEPKIMVQRYVGKKISEVQLNYLIKIISDRTERRAYIKIMCNWLQENSIPWEKLK